MNNSNRLKLAIALVLLLVLTLLSAPAFAQGGAQSPTDLEGEWRRLTAHEDAHERGPGPDPGEYWGLPVNDAERMRADTYNASWVNVSFQLQCRPHRWNHAARQLASSRCRRCSPSIGPAR